VTGSDGQEPARRDGALLNVSESPVAVETCIASRRTETVRSGARSGVLLGGATAVSIVANYAFLLAAGRLLGSEGYGSLAALLGLLAVVLLPAGALQMAVSREVSRRIASGARRDADAFAQGMLRLAALATVPLVAVALALAVPLAGLLNIDSVGVVLLAESTLVTALVFPVAMGVLQGSERFQALAVLYVFPWLLRLVLLAIVAAAGYRLGGAIFCTLVATVAATVGAVELIRAPSLRNARIPRPELRAFLGYLGPVAAGLVGIALLTHVDLLVVKARFADDTAGAYGAASAFARVAFFVPATILAVLFPRTAARQARGEETVDILGRSLLATAGFCAGLAVFYAAAGEGLVAASFGTDFSAGGRVLAPFALAIGLFSLANVLVGYHLSRGERRYAWIVALGVIAQVVVLSTVPSSLRGVVWANACVGAGLLVAHEVFVGSSLPALRTGFAKLAATVDDRTRRVVVEGSLVLLAATALVLLVFLPLTTAIGSTVVGRGSDAAGGVWFFWRLQQEGGYHLFGTTHHTLTGAPFGWNEGNGINVQWLLPYYPGYLLSTLFGAVVAWNLVLLAGYVLSGASMYLLTRYLGCTRLVAAWAGMVFVVFPWHLERTPHASLTHLEVLPLLLLTLVAASRRPSRGRFALVGVATVACWLTSGYFGAMALVAAVGFGLGAFLLWERRRGAVVLLGSAGAAVVGSAFVAFFSAIAGVGRDAGLNRVAGDLSVYGVRVYELVVPAARNVVVGDQLHSFWASRMHGSNPTETNDYLGLLTIALALTWLAIAWRRRTRPGGLRPATVGLLGVAVVALVLSFPSPVRILGHDVWMPSRIVWEVVPAVRVPSRWIALVMAALVPLAALGLQALWRRIGRLELRYGLVAAAAAFSFLELYVPAAEPRIRTKPVPAEYAALAKAPPGVLAEYPLEESTDYLFWQRVHHRPLFNGAPGDSIAEQLRLRLVDPAAPGTAEQLAALGVTAIVTHRNAFHFAEGAPEVPNASWGPGYQLLARAPDGSSSWRVVARPAPAVAIFTGVGDPQRPQGTFVGYAFSSPSGVAYVQLRTTKAGLVRLSFEAQPPAGQTRVLRIADAAGERQVKLSARTTVSLLVELPRGVSELTLKTDPPATSDADAITLAAPRTEAASGTAELHAVAVSS
jgi:O-antigen/teichoic acid export membrane protein